MAIKDRLYYMKQVYESGRKKVVAKSSSPLLTSTHTALCTTPKYS